MTFLRSVFFGDEGSYDIFGTKVEFQNELPFYLTPPRLDGVGVISKLALKCINSNAFRWMTNSYAHVFIHEMSHAIAYKGLIGQNSQVHIFTSLCVGQNQYPSAYASDWKKTAIDIAGPIGDVAFSNCKLVAAVALKNYLSWPVALVLGSGAFIWMSGELLYAFTSASRDDGDFGNIASRGKTHLAFASTVLVSQVALGIFAAIKFAA